MALTRDEFVTEICDVCGKKETAAAVSGATLQTRVRTYLNWAQKRIARHYNFHELNALITTATTLADVKRYPLTTGTNNFGMNRVKDVSSIRLDDSENSRKLDRWSYRKFDEHYPRPENYATLRPSIYVRWGNFLELFRIPNDTYSLKIRYPQWAQDFSSGDQTSDFQDKDQLIITAGIMETYLALEEYADAQVYFQKMLGQLKDAVRAEGDVDWEPEAETMGAMRYTSGEYWLDPYATADDPLGGYPE